MIAIVCVCASSLRRRRHQSQQGAVRITMLENGERRSQDPLMSYELSVIRAAQH
jgi:hypothetical protein